MARQFNEHSRMLELDPAIAQPDYPDRCRHSLPARRLSRRRAPGRCDSRSELRCRPVRHYGAVRSGGLNDGGGQAVVGWVKAERPDWRPRRILDIGCTIGHNAVADRAGIPRCRGHPRSTRAAASLRYGAARAAAMGVTNIRFCAKPRARTCRAGPTGIFDWGQTTMFLHELSAKAMPRILAEANRVLAPGGLILHIGTAAIFGRDAAVRAVHCATGMPFNNNEPFWSAMHGQDLKEVMAKAGFPRDSQFSSPGCARWSIRRSSRPLLMMAREGLWPRRDLERLWRVEAACVRTAGGRREHGRGTTRLGRAVGSARQGQASGISSRIRRSTGFIRRSFALAAEVSASARAAGHDSKRLL